MFAGDPAPQQLTAPCRKYSGRLRAPVEQVVYPRISLGFSRFEALASSPICEHDYNFRHRLLRGGGRNLRSGAGRVARPPLSKAGRRCGDRATARTGPRARGRPAETLTTETGTFELARAAAAPRPADGVGRRLHPRPAGLDLTQGDVIGPSYPAQRRDRHVHGDRHRDGGRRSARRSRASPPSRRWAAPKCRSCRGVLADDPLRAVQVLPGVATGDDLRSEFSVRGSDFGHMNFTVDGFQTPYLLHTVRVNRGSGEHRVGGDGEQRRHRRGHAPERRIRAALR